MKVIKDDRVLEVSEKAYRIIYRDLGYVELKSEATEEPTSEVKKVANAIDYEAMTKSRIGFLLDQRAIEYNPRDNKAKLIDLLLGSD